MRCSLCPLTLCRLLRETGRLSNSPIYVVGIYTGGDQLGEGFGSSLRMAEYRVSTGRDHRLQLNKLSLLGRRPRMRCCVFTLRDNPRTSFNFQRRRLVMREATFSAQRPRHRRIPR